MRYAKNFVSMLAVSAVFALSGCSAPTNEVPTVQPTTESVQTEPVNVPEATPAPANMEDVFVAVIRAKYDLDMPDAELIETGHQVCEAFDNFGVAGTVGIMVQSESAIDPEVLGYVMGASASAFCPEYMDDLHNLG